MDALAKHRPFLPHESGSDPLQPYLRGVTALAVAHARSGDHSPDEVAVELWGETAAALTRGAVSPASTGGWGGALGAQSIGLFLQALAPLSAAARLFERAERVPLGNAHTVALPRVAGQFPAPPWVAEGAPLPVVNGAFTSAKLGPRRKIGFIAGLTGEVATYSGAAAETIVRTAMLEAAAAALDAAVFSADPAAEDRTAGLLHGVAPIAGAAGGGQQAVAADLKALVAALAAAGGGSNILLLMPPEQATALEVLAPGLSLPVAPTKALPSNAVAAVEVGTVASAFDGLPQVTISREAVVHFEDATPSPIGTAGNPPTVAAPTRSAWQEDLLAIRVTLPCAWAMRAPGMVAMVQDTSW